MIFSADVSDVKDDRRLSEKRRDFVSLKIGLDLKEQAIVPRFRRALKGDPAIGVGLIRSDECPVFSDFLLERDRDALSRVAETGVQNMSADHRETFPFMSLIIFDLVPEAAQPQY